MERGALAEAAKALIEELEAPETVRSARAAGLEASSPAAIANAVVVSEGAQLAEQFAADFFRCYKGAALKVDFADPQAAEAVNRWASEQTRGLIPSIVDTLDEGTVASLANAVYFSDRFGREFDPARTRTEAFRALKGASEAQFMHKSGRLPYYEDAEMQAVRLDFSKGSSLSLLLPKKEGEARLASLTAQQAFETAWDGFEPREGALALPKFKIEGSLDLSEALKELGIPLFHASGRPLQGLLQGRDDAFLSSAVQKAVVEVEEKGTTAAASTVFGVSATSVPLPARPFDMRCDRPFAFVLSCPQRGGGALPLFVGCVMNPGAPILES
jgi:serpin B